MLPFLAPAFGSPSSLHERGRAPAEALERARGQVAALVGRRSGGGDLHRRRRRGAQPGRQGPAARQPGDAAATWWRAPSSTRPPWPPAARPRATGAELDLVPVDAEGRVGAADLAAAVRDDTALVARGPRPARHRHAPGRAGARRRRPRRRGRRRAIVVDAGETAGLVPGRRRGHGRRRARRRRAGAGRARLGRGPGRAPGRPPAPAHRGRGRGGRQARRPRGPARRRRARRRGRDRRRPSMAARAARMEALAERLTAGLLAVPDVRLNGPRRGRIPGHVQVSAGWVEGETLALALAARGVAVSPGSACTAHGGKAAPTLEAIGLEPPWTHSAVLFTLRATTTEAEVDARRRGLRRRRGGAARDEPAGAVSAAGARVVDALGTWCPVPIHLIDRAAGRAAPGRGDRAAGRRPLIEVDLPAWCHASGNELLELRRDGADYVGRVAVTRVAVTGHDRVAAAARDQPAVDRQRHDEGHRQGERQRAPEEAAAQPGVHGAGDGQHHRVVDDLHDDDRHRVGRERDADRRPQRHARAQQRDHRQQVAEEERERHGEGDGRRVAPPEGGADHHPQHLADRAAGQAVRGRRDRRARELVHPGMMRRMTETLYAIIHEADGDTIWRWQTGPQGEVRRVRRPPPGPRAGRGHRGDAGALGLAVRAARRPRRRDARGRPRVRARTRSSGPASTPGAPEAQRREAHLPHPGADDVGQDVVRHRVLRREADRPLRDVEAIETVPDGVDRRRAEGEDAQVASLRR